jgi:predicted DNA-binding protein
MCAEVNKSRAGSSDIFFNIRMKPEMHARLTEQAKRNERTTAAEVRMAIREYLERIEAEVAA